MVRKSYFKSKKFANNNIQQGTRGGDHGRLPLPIVTSGGGKRKIKRTKRMVRSDTRIRPGITSGGGKRKIKRTKRMVRSDTRIRPGITSGGGKRKIKRTKRMVRSETRIRPGITA
jgi:hypothetical protein